MEILKLKFFDPVGLAIDRLRQFEPPEGYYGAFSGGKDSECIKKLAEEAEVKVDWHYHLTTLDPPELVYHIRNYHPDVIFEYPAKTIWQLVIEKGIPPTRKARYCCDVLKEGGGEGRFVITGVRWAESRKRKLNRATIEILSSKKDQKKLMNDNDEARRMLEACSGKGKRILNPIIDWEDRDVWNYLKSKQIKYCTLYNEGFKRLGCIGCPIASRGGRIKEFNRWPTYYNAYLRAFEKMLINTEQKKKNKALYWKTAQDVMDWWLYEMPKEDPNQIKMFEE